ncbi:NADPH:quinone reductase [Natrarchaeobius oligotrophus]|uniref:NADPH:quinone reductase n=1 Tax=Natrarchaeobius chitinivorans TaxID=1679083 RepID=A0A3N6NJT5_NATCH|nr:NADPH:quinone reductase [Natrarchaeobius chitinivorans]RQG99402.1 NADPH:quinone reductase [Natrarchaeobius chitinivorans]
MRANRYREYGEPNVLQVEDVEQPEPDRGEVVVAVEAAGVNPLDTKLRSGAYEWATPPMTPGADFAGVVTAVGPGVTDFAEDDRVFGTGLGIGRQGSCAEYVCASLEHVAQLPDNVSFEEGAALALVGVTSWEGLVEKAGLKAGDRCLVHGGSGGVGHVAVQVAKAAGASVTATASPQYHDQVEKLGADTVLDYSRDDLADAIANAGAPDVIMDHRINENIDLNTQVAAQGGRIVAISGTDIELTYSNSGMARGKMQTLHHFAMPQMATFAPALERVATLAGNGQVSPVIERTYGLDEVAQAHEDVVEESFLGKLVVTP